MEDEAEIKESIGNVLQALVARATEERRKSEPYKEMFEASEHGLRGAIDKASNEMMRVVLNLCEVIKERTGKEVNNDLFFMLSGLPLFSQLIRKHIVDTEGNCCCADKMREIAKGFALNNLT